MQMTRAEVKKCFYLNRPKFHYSSNPTLALPQDYPFKDNEQDTLFRPDWTAGCEMEEF